LSAAPAGRPRGCMDTSHCAIHLTFGIEDCSNRFRDPPDKRILHERIF
jgi:hypothetical protein